MDLWIRSQDRRILQKTDNIFLNANYDNKRISSYNDDSATELGTYETKERAFEVLDEIQETICFDEFNYVRKAFREGVVDYFLKPINRQELISHIQKIQKEINNKNNEKSV